MDRPAASFQLVPVAKLTKGEAQLKAVVLLKKVVVRPRVVQVRVHAAGTLLLVGRVQTAVTLPEVLDPKEQARLAVLLEAMELGGLPRVLEAIPKALVANLVAIPKARAASQEVPAVNPKALGVVRLLALVAHLEAQMGACLTAQEVVSPVALVVNQEALGANPEAPEGMHPWALVVHLAARVVACPVVLLMAPAVTREAPEEVHPSALAVHLKALVAVNPSALAVHPEARQAVHPVDRAASPEVAARPEALVVMRPMLLVADCPVDLVGVRLETPGVLLHQKVEAHLPGLAVLLAKVQGVVLRKKVLVLQMVRQQMLRHGPKNQESASLGGSL